MILFGAENRMDFERRSGRSWVEFVKKRQAEIVETGRRAETQPANGPARKIIG